MFKKTILTIMATTTTHTSLPLVQRKHPNIFFEIFSGYFITN
jgi:hypothetical protein